MGWVGEVEVCGGVGSVCVCVCVCVCWVWVYGVYAVKNFIGKYD